MENQKCVALSRHGNGRDTRLCPVRAVQSAAIIQLADLLSMLRQANSGFFAKGGNDLEQFLADEAIDSLWTKMPLMGSDWAEDLCACCERSRKLAADLGIHADEASAIEESFADKNASASGGWMAARAMLPADFRPITRAGRPTR